MKKKKDYQTDKHPEPMILDGEPGVYDYTGYPKKERERLERLRMKEYDRLRRQTIIYD